MKVVALLGVVGLTLWADGVKQVSLHIPDEMAPPGGMMQIKLLVTEPTPITTGNIFLSFDSSMFDAVRGIEVFNMTGFSDGFAVVQGSNISVRYSTTVKNSGTDYPIMTMALAVRPDALVGQKTQFTLDPNTTWILGLLDATTLKPIPPANLTVGGSISITDVVPGGGVVPAGGTVSIRGIGFQAHTQVSLNNIKFSSITPIGPNEIQFTVAQDTEMTGQKIQVVNPDGSQDVYWSYMRGVTVGQSSRTLLQSTVPLFSTQSFSQSAFLLVDPSSASQYGGVAVQNAGASPATVTFSLYSLLGAPLGTSTVTLAPGTRMLRETSELIGVNSPRASCLLVSSTSPVESVGLYADESTNAVYPLAPIFTQR